MTLLLLLLFFPPAPPNPLPLSCLQYSREVFILSHADNARLLFRCQTLWRKSIPVLFIALFHITLLLLLFFFPYTCILVSALELRLTFCYPDRVLWMWSQTVQLLWGVKGWVVFRLTSAIRPSTQGRLGLFWTLPSVRVHHRESQCLVFLIVIGNL